METGLYVLTNLLFIDNMVRSVFHLKKTLSLKLFVLLLISSYLVYLYIPSELIISLYQIFIICLFYFPTPQFFKAFIGTLFMDIIFVHYIHFLFLSFTSSYIYDITQTMSLTPTVFISDAIIKISITLIITTLTHKRDLKIPKVYYLYFYLLDIVALSMMYFIYINSFTLLHVFTKNITILFSFLVFLLNYLGIYLFSLAKTYILKYNESQLILANNEMRLLNYKEVEANQEEVRKLRHDMKNKIMVLSYLMNEKNYDKVHELVQAYHQDIMDHTKIVDTGNTIIDALFNTKMTAHKNIRFIYNLKITDHCIIQDNDLITLIGNLIDNACESLTRDYGQGDLHINLTMDKDMFLLKISNPYKTLNIDDDKFLTLKKDTYNHGIGLKSVKMVVSQYHGTLDINIDNHIFTVKIIIH